MPDPVRNPGRKAGNQGAVARQPWSEDPRTNLLAIAVATLEAKASLLPGQGNGPADAYRHLVWVGEMTRRFGPNNGGLFAEMHEIQGQTSAAQRELTGQGLDPGNSAAATAMDRRNNLLGVSIGQRARTFDDVLRLARDTIERSPKDGSGGVIGAVWLPEEDWASNPSPDRLQWNWPRPDWSRVSRQHVEDYNRAGADYTFTNIRLSAAERRAAIAAEKRTEWRRLLQEHDEPSDGLVQVRAHAREGHPVRAYTRSAP